jgi:hypothetical protein
VFKSAFGGETVGKSALGGNELVAITRRVREL